MTPDRYDNIPPYLIDLDAMPNPEWTPPHETPPYEPIEGIPPPFWDPVERWVRDHWLLIPQALREALEGAAEAIGQTGQWIEDLFGRLVERFDPLTLDLDGGGIGLTRLDLSAVHFDLDGDGFAERTGWVSPGDGLLTLDRNGNGSIDDIGELFGSGELDGYSMLRRDDSNADGLISAADPVFSNLRLWRDANQDGISQSSELASLADLAIVGIGLDAVEAGESIAGNLITHRGTFTYSDGGTGESGAVWFATDQVNTRYQLAEGFEFDPEVFALPNLRGYGRVPDLWIAMTLDPGLKQMVEELVAAGSGLASFDRVLGNVLGGEVDADGASLGEGGTAWATFHGRPLPAYDPDSFERMLSRWANVVEVPPGSETDVWNMFGIDIAPASGGGYSASTILMLDNIALVNSTMAAFLNREISNFAVGNAVYYEAFHQFSTNFALRFYVQVPELAAIEALLDFSEALRLHPPLDGAAYSENEYAAIFAPILQRLEAPPSLGPAVQALAGLDYDIGHDRIVGDPSALIARLLEEFDVDPSAAWSGYDAWYRTNEPYLEAVGVSEAQLEQALRVHSGNAALEILRGPHTMLAGTSGDDQLAGGSARDLLTGGGGNDALAGGAGSDTYVFGDGAGADSVTDASGGADEIALQGGLTSALARYSFAGANRSDLLIAFEGRSEQVVVHGYFDAPGKATVERISFPDGPLADPHAIRAQAMAGLATEGDDAITGFAEANVLVGLGGNDALTGGASADVLTGGAGSDILAGRDGDDAYHFSAGDGQDRIAEGNSRHLSGGADRLIFAPGIAVEDLLLTKPAASPDDLVIAVAGGTDAITIVGQDSAYAGRLYNEIELFVFRTMLSDGTIAETVHAAQELHARRLAQASTAGDDGILGSRRADAFASLAGNDVLQGLEGDDRLDGGAGNDVMKGGAGNDLYVFGRGDGQDRIFEDESQHVQGGSDRLIFKPGITLDDLVLSRPNASDMLIQIAGTGDSILLDDNDVSYQGRYYNRIESFVFQAVQGDGSIAETVVSSAEMNARLIGLAVTEGDDSITGSPNVDEIDGRGGNDLIRGVAGNDMLSGGGGNDRLEGGAGDDVYRFGRGGGQDVLFEAEYQFGHGGADRILFDAGIVLGDLLLSKPADADDLVIAISGTSDTILILDQDLAYQGRTYNRIESFVFQAVQPDGSVVENAVGWAELNARRFGQAMTGGNDAIVGTPNADAIAGGAGADTLSGLDGDDLLAGGAGADILYGGYGSDAYRFDRGDGQDRIADAHGVSKFQANGANDRILFGPGIAIEDIAIVQSAADPKDYLLTLIGTSDSILLDDHGIFSGANHYGRIENFVFQTLAADGSAGTVTIGYAELFAQRLGAQAAPQAYPESPSLFTPEPWHPADSHPAI